jgi:hypothetical protein
MTYLSRRDFLKVGGALGAGTLLPSIALGHTSTDTVCDRLWIWAHIEGSYDNQYGLPNNGYSRMTPPQAAEFLGIPNIIFIRYGKKPEPPYDEYATQYRNTKKLMWSFVGDSSSGTSDAEQEHVLELAQKMPNITGLYMDDFFHGDAKPIGDSDSEAAASITVARLREIRKKMEQINRKLDLGVVLYSHQLNPAIRHHLDLCDTVSFWSWTADDLTKLPENFAKYREIMPNKRTLLGIYMWDFGKGKPLPMNLMKMQCDLGLKWLKNGMIEGMIFLATNICDLDIEAVKWSKQWIAKHGKEKIG